MTIKTQIKEANILIIDDEIFNVTLLSEILDQAGFTSISTYTVPEEGLAHYKNKPVDIVLLDLMMPGIDGFEMMEHFKSIGNENPPPILILTADDSHETRIKALAGNARDFLTKPFDEDEVVFRINNLIELQLSIKQLSDRSITLESLVLERTKELEESQKSIIESLGNAAEYKDTETAAHTVRVGKYVRVLATAYGMDKNDIDVLELSAPLHDIGKIGIPDSILLKPGKFESDEWEIMQSHTSIGAKILEVKPSPLTLSAKEIALSHHEKWDGTGYPKGISGDDIPISGRLTAIADVFDALTMVRPYKKAWSIEKSVIHIKSQSGTHFDPKIVELFMSCLADILKLRNDYSDIVD